MENAINLNNLKNENYMFLSKELNKLLSEYWKLLKFEFKNNLYDSTELINSIVNILNLTDEIKNVIFTTDELHIGGYYNYEEKELNLNVQRLMQLRQLNIISTESFMIEYLTLLFHEVFHAIQYKYMHNYDNYLISKMKELSIQIKKNKNLDTKVHDLIPDEREASIESAKLIYNFVQSNDMICSEEKSEATNNLLFYLKNGYFYSNKIKIFPLQSILKFDVNNINLEYDSLKIYDKLIYGFDVGINPTLSLLDSENKKNY